MKKEITIAGLLLAMALVAGSAKAYVPIPNINPQIDPAVFKAFQKSKCEKVEEKIQVRIEKLEKYQESHLAAYKNLKDRLTKLAEKLTLKGYDATELQAGIVVLQEKIDKFSAEYAAALEKMELSQTFDCNGNYAEFKVKVGEARTALKQVHQNSKEIRDYYFNTIRPDIKKIRDQKPVETK